MSGQVTAILGPTNTGKTYWAIERMLGYQNGIIGFPLRLLARENYDKIVRIKGANAVALITGEEKIIPKRARYYICTVEAMPQDIPVEFVGVDEIQLCGDPERGHVFTDRLLHMRGRHETVFMGSEAIEPLMKRLLSDVDIEKRPRFSNLSYSGYRKIRSLPRRSAIIAFSVNDVYYLAEQIRRQRGGTAIVMGGLSPRTRNAQVEMYQSGEVDYLVATDAIGMGLNMDIDHIAFARNRKFDGQMPRHLTAAELAQIAGRAGRHMQDGTFGVTDELREFPEDVIEAIENHRFPELKKIFYRNSRLDYRSIKDLKRSLEKRSDEDCLIRVRDSEDQLSLEFLALDPEILKIATNAHKVKLLWDVCQIPDFRKTMSDAHVNMLKQIYIYLNNQHGKLPEDWVHSQLKRLDRVEGDIDILTTRLSYIRTWTYISHREEWLNDAKNWQQVTHAIEDKLSDALHEKLTQRFVDKRSALLVRSLLTGGELMATVNKQGEVMVEGQHVGTLQGLHFVPDQSASVEDEKALLSAARKALTDEIARRVLVIEAASDEVLSLAADGTIHWGEHPIAKLTKSEDIYLPNVSVINDDLVTDEQRERLSARLQKWVKAYIDEVLEPLLKAKEIEDLSPAARGIAFQIHESLGTVHRSQVVEILEDVTKEDRTALRRGGVRISATWLYCDKLLKPKAVTLRAVLFAIYHDMPLPAILPNDGRMSQPQEGLSDPALLKAAGYPMAGRYVVRSDMLDRFEQKLWNFQTETKDMEGFPLVPELAQEIGCQAEDLPDVVKSLGARRLKEGKPAIKDEEGNVTEAGEPDIYRLRAPRLKKKAETASSKSSKGKPHSKKAVKRKEKPMDPDSPFAALANLKIGK